MVKSNHENNPHHSSNHNNHRTRSHHHTETLGGSIGQFHIKGILIYYFAL